MDIEVLVSAMHQKDMSIADKMNINTDAIIINQCDENNFCENMHNGKTIRMYSFNERGVGKSRNNALMRATGDICIMADDDVVYVDGYENIIKEAFENNSKADMIMFNVPSYNKDRQSVKIISSQLVRWYNCLRYGTFNIVFRRQSVLRANVFFSLLFGGGAIYSSGEDSLFISDCLRRGLNIYVNPAVIGHVYQNESTWYKGYNQKFFYDKGIFFAALSNKYAILLILQFVIRKHFLYKSEMSFYNACKFMIEGMRHWNSNKR